MATIVLPKTDEELKTFLGPVKFVGFLKMLTGPKDKLLMHCIISNSALENKYALLTNVVKILANSGQAAVSFGEEFGAAEALRSTDIVFQFITEQLLYEQAVQRGEAYQPDVFLKLNRSFDVKEKLNLIEKGYFPNPLLFSKRQTDSIFSTLSEIVYTCMHQGNSKVFERAVNCFVRVHTTEAKTKLESILRDNSLILGLLTQDDSKEKYRRVLEQALDLIKGGSK